PFSKAVREPDPKVDEYLDKLAARLQQTDETVSIVGHTDNIGDEASNQELGLARARHIRDVLVSKGISADRITISSKGESEPIADNDSEAGRRRNRRAVLQLHKKE
ncbi:MAG: OmpA family protein, partial [Bacteroidetes bacterium]